MGRPLKIQKQGYAGNPGDPVNAAYPQIGTLTDPVTPPGLTTNNFYGVVGGNVQNSQPVGYPNGNVTMADGSATFPVLWTAANITGSGTSYAWITRQKGSSKFLVTSQLTGDTGVCYLTNSPFGALTKGQMNIEISNPNGVEDGLFLKRITNKYGIGYDNEQYFVNFFTPLDTSGSLGAVTITGVAGTFTCPSAPLLVNDPVTVSGTTSSTTVTGVDITGTAGQFSCTASSKPLVTGQRVTISGTFGGTGSIDTPAYSDPTTYYIIATNGSTTFTLSDTLGGTALATTAGTPTGLTYTLNAGSITGYTNPKTYYITATNGSTSFTLSTAIGGSAVTTVAGQTNGLTFALAGGVEQVAKSGADKATFANGTGNITLALAPNTLNNWC
jgi:hypothetical protein